MFVITCNILLYSPLPSSSPSLSSQATSASLIAIDHKNTTKSKPTLTNSTTVSKTSRRPKMKMINPYSSAHPSTRPSAGTTPAALLPAATRPSASISAQPSASVALPRELKVRNFRAERLSITLAAPTTASASAPLKSGFKQASSTPKSVHWPDKYWVVRICPDTKDLVHARELKQLIHKNNRITGRILSLYFNKYNPKRSSMSLRLNQLLDDVYTYLTDAELQLFEDAYKAEKKQKAHQKDQSVC